MEQTSKSILRNLLIPGYTTYFVSRAIKKELSEHPITADGKASPLLGMAVVYGMAVGLDVVKLFAYVDICKGLVQKILT